MNYKISELQTRYDLKSKQSIYDRMRALHIKPINRGEISNDSLNKLDKLNEFIKNNPRAAIWEFPKDTEILSTEQLDKSTEQLDKSTGQLDKSTGQLDKSTGQLDKSTEQLDKSTGQLDKSTGQLDNFNETLQLVEAIARHFANQDPLTKYKALEYAAKYIPLLPTSKIYELTGAKPRRNQFQRGIFISPKLKLKSAEKQLGKFTT